MIGSRCFARPPGKMNNIFTYEWIRMDMQFMTGAILSFLKFHFIDLSVVELNDTTYPFWMVTYEQNLPNRQRRSDTLQKAVCDWSAHNKVLDLHSHTRPAPNITREWFKFCNLHPSLVCELKLERGQQSQLSRNLSSRTITGHKKQISWSSLQGTYLWW